MGARQANRTDARPSSTQPRRGDHRGLRYRSLWPRCARRPCCFLTLAVALLLLATAPAGAFHAPGLVESGITTGPDGNLWAAFWHEGTGLYRISPAGQISQVGAGEPEGPLAVGSDGNLWAAVEHSGFGGIAGYPGIARIFPSGQVALFAPPPTAPAFEYESAGMATGPDGNVWSISGPVNGNDEQINLRRITPAGQITEYPIPLSLVAGLAPTAQNELAPRAIAAGGGVLWLLSERGLIRLTTAGQMSLLPIMATQANPTGLAYGPDGNLWATYGAVMPDILQVRRITPAGVVTAIPVPGVHTSGDQAVGITTGPDGNLWLADGSRILRITPARAVTEFPAGLPAADQAEAITTGPDGNLWFTARYVIGRITTNGSVTDFPLPGVTPPPTPRCLVPNLKHQTLPEAKRLLLLAHCAIGAITRPKRGGKHKLRVVRQQPAANTTLPIESRVGVVLGEESSRRG